MDDLFLSKIRIGNKTEVFIFSNMEQEIFDVGLSVLYSGGTCFTYTSRN